MFLTVAEAVFRFGKIHVASTTNIILNESQWIQVLLTQSSSIEAAKREELLRGKGSQDKVQIISLGSLKTQEFSKTNMTQIRITMH